MEQNETTTSQYDMTFPYSRTTQAVTATPSSQIAQQALNDMQEIQAGYFTVFLLELARVFSKKQHQDAARLLQSLESEVMALLSAKKLSGFGKSTIAAFVRFVRAMNNVPADAVQYEANLAVYIMMNRRQTLGREIVNVLDETDRIFQEEEGRRILHVLEDIDNYPNINKTAQEVVHEMMDAVVVAPFIRVYGTAEEMTIVRQIEDLVIRMVFSGFAIQRRKGGVHSLDFESRKKYKTSGKYRNAKQITRVIQKHTRRKHLISTLRKLRSTYTTIRNRQHSNLKKFKSFHSTTRNLLKKNHKLIDTIKKNKYKKYRKEEEIRRKIPKKIINKHIGKYNGIYLKLADLEVLEEANKINIKAGSEKFTTRSKYHKTQSTEFDKSKNKVDVSLSSSKRFKFIELKTKENDWKRYKFSPTNKGEEKVEESSFTDDEEEKLRANLYDAFFHGNDELEFRNTERINIKHSPVSSYSNEEALLKSKIYKVFGYGNDFANAIKRKKYIG